MSYKENFCELELFIDGKKVFGFIRKKEEFDNKEITFKIKSGEF